MKSKIKTFLSLQCGNVKAQPIAFAGAVTILLVGLINTLIGSIALSFYDAFAGAYSVILGAAKLYGVLSFGDINSINDKEIMHKREKSVSNRLAITAAVLSFLHFSFAIVCAFFYEQSTPSYSRLVAYYYGAIAVVSIIISVINSIFTYKKRSLVVQELGLISLANSLILLSVAQRIILTYLNVENTKLISGIGGIIFSVLAGIISLYMFIKIYRKKSN